MTDTLMIPKEVRAEMTEEQQQEQYRRQNQQLLAAETIGQRADGQGSRAGTNQHG